jgi:hypothetical protein
LVFVSLKRLPPANLTPLFWAFDAILSPSILPAPGPGDTIVSGLKRSPVAHLTPFFDALDAILLPSILPAPGPGVVVTSEDSWKRSPFIHLTPPVVALCAMLSRSMFPAPGPGVAASDVSKRGAVEIAGPGPFSGVAKTNFFGDDLPCGELIVGSVTVI